MHLARIATLLTLTLCAASAADAPVGVDKLTPADVARAVSALKTDYVKPESLSDAEMARAILQGLLDRLSPGVSLASGSDAAAGVVPFYSQQAGPGAAYVRLGELTGANVARARGALHQWTGLSALVLDLRATPPSSDFAAGADFEQLFCAKGTDMFTLQSPSRPGPPSSAGFAAKAEPLFKGILVILVDTDTAEAPEAIAASLQRTARALIVGDKTAGRPYRYREVPLSGAVLRIATAQVSLPDGRELTESGLAPDISVPRGAVSKRDLMRAITAQGLDSVTSEHDRPHLNEAALVSGSNPDVDELQAEQSQKKPAGPRIDRQLQRALDLVTSIQIYRGRVP